MDQLLAELAKQFGEQRKQQLKVGFVATLAIPSFYLLCVFFLFFCFPLFFFLFLQRTYVCWLVAAVAVVL